MVSLRAQFHEHSRRQRLQRRIDLLVASSTHPYGRTATQRTWIDPFLDGEEMEDVNPIVTQVTKAIQKSQGEMSLLQQSNDFAAQMTHPLKTIALGTSPLQLSNVI